jgi:periplasmic protein TonB
MMIPSLLLIFVAAQSTAQAPAPGIMVTNSPPPVFTAPPAIALPVVSAIAPPPPRIVRRPQQRASAQSYVSPADYPAAAFGTGAHGTVGFTLAIGENGRVIGCAITRSSGSALLDSVTCSIMRRRAKFTPAVDSNGNPTAATIEQEVQWKAP